jgi:hypothetical protein
VYVGPRGVYNQGYDMKRTCRLPILFTVAALLFHGAAVARADESMNSADDYGSAGSDVPSQKQYDKRLPPVLPGEEIVTESGKKMRVWSSAGPVPINQPTAIAYPNGGGYYGGFPPVIINDPGFRGGAGAPGAGVMPGGAGGGVAPMGRGGR